MKVGKYMKALVAAVTAGAGSLATALMDDTVTTGEWTTLALVVLAALGATYRVPNKPPVHEGE